MRARWECPLIIYGSPPLPSPSCPPPAHLGHRGAPPVGVQQHRQAARTGARDHDLQAGGGRKEKGKGEFGGARGGQRAAPLTHPHRTSLERALPAG